MDAQEVRRVAHLARLALSDAEIEKLRSQFTNILGYIRKIDRLNLEGVDPVSHPFNITNVFRDDWVVPPLGEKIVRIAPVSDRGMVQVPLVVGTAEP